MLQVDDLAVLKVAVLGNSCGAELSRALFDDVVGHFLDDSAVACEGDLDVHGLVEEDRGLV